MINLFPVIEEPNWLRADTATLQDAAFPLDGILRDSLYYPSSGFDGDPVRHLAGNVLGFVYVDYGESREDLDDALRNRGFKGYDVIARRDVTEKELTPRGWSRTPPSPADGDPSRYRDWIKKPFCSWIVLERAREMTDCHGPRRFTLLYLCADGVAAYQALYEANGRFPAFVAIIQPGHGFGGNWTDFTDPEAIFTQSVLQNPAGHPEFLLYGGYGEQHDYMPACWPSYSELVCFFDKAGGGTIGAWRKA